MGRDVQRLVRACDLCQRTKRRNHKLEGPTQPILAEAIGDLVSIDFYGPLPPTRGRSTYLLVALDVFSKYVKIYPLRRATTAAALRRITEFATIIHPRTILSDHGTQFTSRKWIDGLAKMGTRATFSSIRHPNSNPVERYMKEIGRFFRAYCSENHASWGTKVADLEFVLNSTPNASTGYAPTEILTGRSAVFQLDGAISRFLEPQAETSEAIRRKVRENLNNQALRRAKRQRKTTSTFKLGDLVLLESNPVPNASEGLNKKFQRLYHGPYQIQAIPYCNVYSLYDNIQRKRVGNFNITNLVPYVLLH